MISVLALGFIQAFVMPQTGSAVPEGRMLRPGYAAAADLPLYAAGEGEWTGSGPWGGNLRGLAASWSDDDIVLAGCGFSMASDAGGVWRSTDGGVTWEGTELNPIQVNDVCSAGPAAPATFYASTRTGLHVSDDNGLTWSPVPGMSTAYVLGAGVHRENPDILVAGLSSNNGIRRSADGGVTWEEVGLSEGFFKGFGSDPESPDTMYVAMSGLDHSLYRSTDAGASWTPVGPSVSGWGVLVGPFGTGETIIVTTSDGFYMSTDHGASWDLAVPGTSYAPAVYDGSTLYAPVIAEAGVYESIDQGVTWELNTEGVYASFWQAGCVSSSGCLLGHWGGVYRTAGPGDVYTVSQEGIDNTFIHAVSYSQSTGTLLAGGDGHGLWRSADQGQTWEIVLPGPSAWTIYDIAPGSEFHYDGPVRYIATDDGVLRSDDWGDSWASAGFSGTQVSSVAFHPDDPDVAWAGTAASGVHYTTDGGSTWTEGSGFPFALYPSIALVDLPSGELRVLVSFQQMGDGVYYSDDLGVSYTLSPVGGSYHPGLSALWGEDPMVYLATDGGIHRSFDRGETWEACPGSSGLMWAVQGSLNSNVFAGTNGSGVRWSPDLGDTWEALGTGISGRVVWDVIYGQDAAQLFAGLRGFGVVELTEPQLGTDPASPVPSRFTVTAFPNPAVSSVDLVLTGLSGGAAEVSVYASDGRLVYRETVEQGNSSSWSSFGDIPSGVYLVRAVTADAEACSKVVLMR